MEAARLVQFKEQYTRANARGRLCALLASLRVTCESYLKTVGVHVKGEEQKYVRMMKLLTETHIQSCMMKDAEVLLSQKLELDSLLQLAHFIAKEYVLEMHEYRTRALNAHKQSPACQLVLPVPHLRGDLQRHGPSAFRALSTKGTSSASSEAGTTDEGDTSPHEDEEICRHIVSLTPESADESMSDAAQEWSDDEYEFCTNVDGTSEAQCQCYACVLNENTGRET